MSAKLTVEEGKSMMRQYCNFQERCHQDVRTKGLSLGFRSHELEEIISAMISEGLLDEERFARALARGKFRNNQWGRVKITQALKQRAIPEYCIRKALTEINDTEYKIVIKKLIATKQKSVGISKAGNQKVISYLLQKGFEYEVVREVMGEEV
jgi:regulatory protein